MPHLLKFPPYNVSHLAFYEKRQHQRRARRTCIIVMLLAGRISVSVTKKRVTRAAPFRSESPSVAEDIEPGTADRAVRDAVTRSCAIMKNGMTETAVASSLQLDARNRNSLGDSPSAPPLKLRAQK